MSITFTTFLLSHSVTKYKLWIFIYNFFVITQFVWKVSWRKDDGWYWSTFKFDSSPENNNYLVQKIHLFKLSASASSASARFLYIKEWKPTIWRNKGAAGTKLTRAASWKSERSRPGRQSTIIIPLFIDLCTPYQPTRLVDERRRKVLHVKREPASSLTFPPNQTHPHLPKEKQHVFSISAYKH